MQKRQSLRWLRSTRFTLVVAAAGYGKTSAIRDRLRGAQTRWLSAEELLNGTLSSDTWPVVDDLSAVDVAAVFERAEQHSSLVAICRTVADGSATLSRLRGRGDLTELGPADLALRLEQTTAVLRHEYGVTSDELCAQVHALTMGWPALVHLTGSGLSNVEDLRDASLHTVYEYLRHEVVETLSETQLSLLVDAAHIGVVTPELLVSLGHGQSIVDQLIGMGLLRREGSEFQVVPLLAKLVGKGADELLLQAASWYADNNAPLAAVRIYRAAGQRGKAVELLTTHGEQILAGGGAPLVLEMAECGNDALRMYYADALYMSGDPVAAIAVLKSLNADQSPMVAWRLGLIHYLAGEPHAALDVLTKAVADGQSLTDEARWHGWAASVYWQIADVAKCQEHAELAMQAAVSSQDPSALAAAYVARALHAKIAGDPVTNRQSYERALRLAEQARDAVVTTRIRCNNSSRLCDDARYDDALAQARPAVRLATSVGHVTMQALALVNEGNALVGLGRLEEALASFEQSVWLYRRTGSRMIAYSLNGVGRVHRCCGRADLARAAFEESVRVAGVNRQAMIPALAGLTHLAAASDPAAAKGYAAQAMAVYPDSTVSQLATGWALLAAGDRSEAARVAASVAEQARRLQERRVLPEALELMGTAAATPILARQSLREAQLLWRHAGSTLDVDRMTVGIGALPAAGPEERLEAKLAAARLAAAGVELGAAGGMPRISVRGFGRFEVRVAGGAPVMWQSRKARDLLRILVARRGRAVPRDELGELLWPDDDVSKVGHRLSVALSTVRGVLDPDRNAPTDHFVLSGQGSVALETNRIDIDFEDFLVAADHGLRLARDGDIDMARPLLADALRLYTGDLFGDEPYDDWAVAAREEARAVYLRVARMLVELARDAGDTAEAVGYIHRVLDIDPYDESAHRSLVDLLTAHGWHGEARRAQQRYQEAMRRLGLGL